MEKSEILQMALATIESKDKRIEKLQKEVEELRKHIEEAYNLLNKCNSNDVNIDRAMELLNKYNK